MPLPNSSPPPHSSKAAPRVSLFASGLGFRLALAAGLSALVWLAVGWALSA